MSFCTVVTAVLVGIVAFTAGELAAFRTIKAFCNQNKASANVAAFYLAALVFIFDNCGVSRNVGCFLTADYITGNHIFVAHSKGSRIKFWFLSLSALRSPAFRTEFHSESDCCPTRHAFFFLGKGTSAVTAKFHSFGNFRATIIAFHISVSPAFFY